MKFLISLPIPTWNGTAFLDGNVNAAGGANLGVIRYRLQPLNCKRLERMMLQHLS